MFTKRIVSCKSRGVSDKNKLEQSRVEKRRSCIKKNKIPI